MSRMERSQAIRNFLERSGWGDAVRAHLTGDASARSYETVSLEGEPERILMNSPPLVLGPPVRDGKPYSAIVHLAEDVKPFVAMANGLRQLGLSAPRIHQADIDEGLLIIEDLGSELVVAGDPPAPIEQRYAAAVDVLVALHGRPLPASLPVAPQVRHTLPRYDMDALTSLVQEDATQSMPPYDLWLSGRDDIFRWWFGPGIGCQGSRVIPTLAANGSPAFGQYKPAEDGGFEPWALQVVELENGKIKELTFFLETETLFPLFGLPPRLDA